MRDVLLVLARSMSAWSVPMLSRRESIAPTVDGSACATRRYVSEKIRTYNYPQNRLTDHRINLTLYSLSDILQGDLSSVIEALIKADRLARLES